MNPVDPVMTHHVVHRNGSVWACRFCLASWPFPAPVPRTADPCTPRRWSDGFADEPPANLPVAGPPCTDCGATGTEPCRDLRSVNRPAKRQHRGRST